jgi:hypothetical protein
MTGTLVSPVGPWWFRGSAQRDGDDVVARAPELEWYEPGDDRRIGVALAHVREPADVVRFVQRYGLLTAFEDSEIASYRRIVDQRALSVRDRLRVFPPGQEFRESVKSFLDEAQRLHWLLSNALDLRSALEGEKAAVERLSRSAASFIDAHPNVPSVGADASEAERRFIVLMASQFAKQAQRDIASPVPFIAKVVAETASARMSGMQPYLRADDGQFEMRVEAKNLLDYCYLTVAQALTREPLAACPECGRVFVVEDKRQKYCRPACAARARFRRFDERRRRGER